MQFQVYWTSISTAWQGFPLQALLTLYCLDPWPKAKGVGLGLTKGGCCHPVICYLGTHQTPFLEVLISMVALLHPCLKRQTHLPSGQSLRFLCAAVVQRSMSDSRAGHRRLRCLPVHQRHEAGKISHFPGGPFSICRSCKSQTFGRIAQRPHTDPMSHDIV